MTDPQVAIMMMGLFVVFVLLGFPICFTLIAMGVIFGYYAYAQPDQLDHIFQNQIFDLLVNQTYSVMINDVLVAVPLFLFIGYILERANIVIRGAFKPTATIMRPQETVDVDGNPAVMEARGRHDPCVLPRAVPIVEAMMALVLVDHALRQRGQSGRA